jgi:hypothetical protein
VAELFGKAVGKKRKCEILRREGLSKHRFLSSERSIPSYLR